MYRYQPPKLVVFETHNRSGGHRFLLAVLLRDDFGQLLLGPVFDRVVLSISHIHMNGPFLRFPLNGQVMGKLTLVTLGTGSLLEECTQDRLGVGAFFDFLRWNRLEQLSQFLLLLQLLFLLLLLGIRIIQQVMLASAFHLLLNLGDKLLLFSSFLVLQTECFILFATNNISKRYFLLYLPLKDEEHKNDHRN